MATVSSPNVHDFQHLKAPRVESYPASSQVSSAAHPAQNLIILPPASPILRNTRPSQLIRHNSVAQRPLRSSPLAELAFSVDVLTSENNEEGSKPPLPARQASVPNISLQIDVGTLVPPKRPRSAEASHRPRTQVHSQRESSPASSSHTIRSRSSLPSERNSLRDQFGQPQIRSAGQSDSRLDEPIPPLPRNHIRAQTHSTATTPDPSRVRSPEGSDSWLTATPYLTTPRFTRLSLGSDGVVLPVSAREYKRRTSHSNYRASMLVTERASHGRPKSLITPLSSIDDLPNFPPQVVRSNSVASSHTDSSMASSGSFYESRGSSRLSSIDDVGDFGVVVNVIEMKSRKSSSATAGRGLLSKFVHLGQQVSDTPESHQVHEPSHMRYRLLRFFSIRSRFKAPPKSEVLAASDLPFVKSCS